jgi:formylglycine-generating enzyme required for sulfatase activity/serine/threonine protein kinase
MLERGDKIGDYTLVRFLGRGQFGEVWLAEKHLQFSKRTFQHALKFLFNLGDEINLRSAEAEIDTWIEASGHPNVMSVLDMLIHNDHIIIASEFAEGGSLKGWLAQSGGRAPSYEKALEMMTGILSGIEHLHSRNVVHRDLKPDNILLQGNFPRITDFGISRIISAGSMSTVAMGSPFYMSPESFDGSKSTQTDIWSAGVILYEMLTGEHPYRSETIYGLVSAIRQAEPKPLPAQIPAGLRGIVETALQKDLSSRYQTAEEMRNAIELEVYDIKLGIKTLAGTADNLRAAADPAVTLVNEYFDRSSIPNESPPGATGERAGDVRKAVTEIYNVGESLKGTPQEQYIRRDDVVPPAPVPQTEPPPVPPRHEASVQIPDGPAQFQSMPLPRPEAGLTPSSVEAPSAGLSGSQFGQSNFSQTHRPLAIIGGIGGAVIVAGILIAIGAVAVFFAARSFLLRPIEPAANKPAEIRTEVVPVAPAGMAYVAGGQFMMGRDSGEIPEEKPAHSVTVRPFFMDIYEVTNQGYAEFVKLTGHKSPQGWKNGSYPSGEEQFPVVGVSWNDAVDFAEWKGKRLPTEEEWEFAARGPGDLLYPWGNDWLPREANVDGASRSFVEVGQFGGRSPYGMFDMVGNAGEWTSNDFKAYPNGRVSDIYDGKSDLKTRRGSDYATTKEYATTTFRFGYPATGADYSLTGFRCAKDIGN